MLDYLAGLRIGAATYNVVHSYVWPILVAGLGAIYGGGWPLALGLIWAAHIGMAARLWAQVPDWVQAHASELAF